MRTVGLVVLLLLSLFALVSSRPAIESRGILNVLKDIGHLNSFINENDNEVDDDDDDENEKPDTLVARDDISNTTNTNTTTGESAKNVEEPKTETLDSIPIGQRLTSEQKIVNSKPVPSNEGEKAGNSPQELKTADAAEKSSEAGKQDQNITAAASSNVNENDTSKEPEITDERKVEDKDVVKTKSVIAKGEENEEAEDLDNDENDDEGSGSEEDTEEKDDAKVEESKELEDKNNNEKAEKEIASVNEPSKDVEEDNKSDEDDKVKMFFISPFEKSEEEQSTTRQILTYPAVGHGEPIHSHHWGPSHIWNSDYPYFAYGYSWGCGNHMNGGYHSLKRSNTNKKKNKKSDLLCRDYMLLPAISKSALRAAVEAAHTPVNGVTRQTVVSKDVACSDDDTECAQRQVIGSMAGGSMFGDGMGGLGMGFPGIPGIHTGISGYNLAGGMGGHGHHGHGHGNSFGGYGGYGGMGANHFFRNNEHGFSSYWAGRNSIPKTTERAQKKASVKKSKRKAKKKHLVGMNGEIGNFGEFGGRGYGTAAGFSNNGLGGDIVSNGGIVDGFENGANGCNGLGPSACDGLNPPIGNRVVGEVADGVNGPAAGPSVLGVGVGCPDSSTVCTDSPGAGIGVNDHGIDDGQLSGGLQGNFNGAPTFNLAGANLGGMLGDRLNRFGGGGGVGGGGGLNGNYGWGAGANIQGGSLGWGNQRVEGPNSFTGMNSHAYGENVGNAHMFGESGGDFEPEEPLPGDGVGHPYFSNSPVNDEYRGDGYGPPILGPPIRNPYGLSHLEQSFMNNPNGMKYGYGGSIGGGGGLELDGFHSNFAYKSKIKKKKGHTSKQVKGTTRQDIAMPDEQAMMDVTKQRQLIGSLGASTLFSDNVGGMGLGHPGVPGMSSGISGIPGEYGGTGGYAHGWEGHGAGQHPHGYNNFNGGDGEMADYGGGHDGGEHETGYDRSFNPNEQEYQQQQEMGHKRGEIFAPAIHPASRMISAETIDIPAQDLDNLKYSDIHPLVLDHPTSDFIHTPSQNNLIEDHEGRKRYISRYNSNLGRGDVNLYQPRHVHVGVGTPNVKVEVETSKSEIARGPAVHVSAQKMSEIKKLVHEVSASLKRTNKKLNALKKIHTPKGSGDKRQITPAYTPVVSEPAGVPPIRYPVPAADRYPLGAGYIWPSANYGHQYGGPYSWSKSHTPRTTHHKHEVSESTKKHEGIKHHDKLKKRKNQHSSGIERRSISSKSKKHEKVGTKRQFLEHPMNYGGHGGYPYHGGMPIYGFGGGMGYPVHGGSGYGHGGIGGGGYGLGGGHYGGHHMGHIMRGGLGYHNNPYGGGYGGGHTMIIHNPVHVMSYGGGGPGGYGGGSYGGHDSGMMEGLPMRGGQFSGLPHTDTFDGHHGSLGGGFFAGHGLGGMESGGHESMMGHDMFMGGGGGHSEGFPMAGNGMGPGYGNGGLGNAISGFSNHAGPYGSGGGGGFNNFGGFSDFGHGSSGHGDIGGHGSPLSLDPSMASMNDDSMHGPPGMGHAIGIPTSQGVPGGNMGLNSLGAGPGDISGGGPMIPGMSGMQGMGGMGPMEQGNGGSMLQFSDHGVDQPSGGYEGGLPGFDIESMRQQDQNSGDPSALIPAMGHPDTQEQMGGSPMMPDSHSSMFLPLREQGMSTYGADLRAMDYPGASKKSEVPDFKKSKKKNRA